MARRLNIAKSLLVVKFFFRLLTKTENTELLINFFQLSSEEFLALCQHYSLSQCGFAAPFANNFQFLSQLCDVVFVKRKLNPSKAQTPCRNRTDRLSDKLTKEIAEMFHKFPNK